MLGLEERGEREHEQCRDLDHQEDAEDLGGQLDVEVGQGQHDRERAEFPDPDRDVDAEPVVYRRVGEVSRDARDTGGEERVAGGDQQRDAHAHALAEPVRREAVEAAGCRHTTGHRDVTDGEDGEGDSRHDEGARSGPAAAVDGPVIVEQHRGDRRSAGHDAEQHLRQAEGVAGEPVSRLDHGGTLHDHLPFHTMGAPLGNAAWREATVRRICSTRLVARTWWRESTRPSAAAWHHRRGMKARRGGRE